MFHTNATKAVAPCKDDFVSFKSNHKEKRVIKGITKDLKIEGCGIADYYFNADDGSEIVLKCNDGYARLEVDPITDVWYNMSPIHTKRMDLYQRNNLHWFMIRTKKTIEENVMGLQIAVYLAAEQNQNLTSAQKELLCWHQRLCHVNVSTIQWLARLGHLPVKNPDAFAKQKRRPCKATKSHKNTEKEAELKKKNLLPGQHLSAGHYQSAVSKRNYSSRWSYYPEDLFSG
eukprot:11321119-Ditylum_brightwellii.AAC.1